MHPGVLRNGALVRALLSFGVACTAEWQRECTGPGAKREAEGNAEGERCEPSDAVKRGKASR